MQQLFAQLLFLLVGDDDQQLVNHFAGLLLLRYEHLLQFLNLLGEKLNAIRIVVNFTCQRC